MKKGALGAGLLCAMALARPGFSVVNTVAGLANPLENNGAGARAMGMGSAFVGVADDASTLFWNPAGLGNLKSTELEWDNNAGLAGIVQETAMLALPLGSLGTMGAAINYVNYGTLNAYNDTGQQVGSYSPNQYGFDLGWGKAIQNNLSFGATLKGSEQTLGTSSYADLAVDLGGLWHPWRTLGVGLALTNLGTQVAGYSEDTALRPGVSYLFDLSDTNQLLIAAAGSWEPQGVNGLQIGAEDTIFHLLSLRVGYQGQLAATQIQGLSGWTGGLGLTAEGFNLDYAFLPFGDLGATNWITLGYKFD